jgi:hypothetical protein
MNPLECALYGGIAGIEMPVDEFDFGHGIYVKAYILPCIRAVFSSIWSSKC